jgi:tRNA (guanine37-N1)-methyltransferase
VRFSVITIFPELIRGFLNYGLLEKAIGKGLVAVDVYDLREFSRNKHRKVDDRPLGGGPGMVLMPDPLFRAVEFIQNRQPGRVILFSAYGRILEQKKIKSLAKAEHLIMICGRYEGVDQRAIDELVDEEISLGEYVLMGGEIAAEALLESVSRMIPGVVGNPESVQGDSFYHEDQYAFPQYTQPRAYRDLAVPELLLSGNHKQIEQWRLKNRKTRRKENEKNS